MITHFEKKIVVLVAVFGAILLWLSIYGGRIGCYSNVSSDNYQNISYAFYMLVDKVFTAEKGGNSVTPNEYHPPVAMTPSGWREPGYPAFIAAVFWVDGLFSGDSRELIFHDSVLNTAHSSIKSLQMAQIFLLFLVGLVGFGLSFQILQNLFFSYIVFVATIFNPCLVNSALSVGWVETLHALLLGSLSYAFIRLYKELDWGWLSISGFLLSAIILVSSLWLYFIPVSVLLVFGYGFQKFGIKKSIQISLFFLSLATLLPTMWIIRNYLYFDRPAISFKGGLVLDVRAEMSKMSAAEYAKSFFYWSGSSFLKDITILKGNYERLETHGPKSFFRLALDRRLKLNSQFGRSSVADKIQTSEAIRKIAKNKIMHLALFVPISLRLFSGWFPFGILLFVSSVVLIVIFLKDKEHCKIAAMLPMLYYFSFLVVFSHGLPRYGVVLYPMLVCFGFSTLRLLCNSGKWLLAPFFRFVRRQSWQIFLLVQVVFA